MFLKFSVYVGSLKVQLVDNLFKCPDENCSKTFRKENHFQIHVKHYHPSLVEYVLFFYYCLKNLFEIFKITVNLEHVQILWILLTRELLLHHNQLSNLRIKSQTNNFSLKCIYRTNKLDFNVVL